MTKKLRNATLIVALLLCACAKKSPPTPTPVPTQEPVVWTVSIDITVEEMETGKVEAREHTWKYRDEDETVKVWSPRAGLMITAMTLTSPDTNSVHVQIKGPRYVHPQVILLEPNVELDTTEIGHIFGTTGSSEFFIVGIYTGTD